MRVLVGVCCCLVAGMLLLQAWGVSADTKPVSLLKTRCTVCHDLERVRARVDKKDKDGWLELITRMQGNGAKVSDADKQELADHLSGLSAPDF